MSPGSGKRSRSRPASAIIGSSCQRATSSSAAATCRCWGRSRMSTALPRGVVPPSSALPTGTPPDVAAHCGITEDEWTRMLLDLLPVGAAWPRGPDTTLMRFWSAVAIEPTRIQARDCDLLAESYPCGAVELLPEWEAAVGLPNECTEGLTLTLGGRHALVCPWLAHAGWAEAASSHSLP